MRRSTRLAFIALLFVAIAIGKLRADSSRIPSRARIAIQPISVMYIVLQPGYEDLRVLAYYAFVKAARVRVVYVTNGGGTWHEHVGSYPHEMAATLRLEATAALEQLGGEAHFLNLPDVVSARDSVKARLLWQKDSLQEKLHNVIGEFGPDLILLGSDREANDPLRTSIVLHDLVAVLDERESPPSEYRIRVALEALGRTVLTVPTEATDPITRMSCSRIADSLDRTYQSIALQRAQWMKSATTSFRVLRPERFSAKTLDGGLPIGIPTELHSIASAVNVIVKRRAATSSPSVSASSRLREVQALLATINQRIVRYLSGPSVPRRVLLRWKGSLEEYRNELLGVRVSFNVSDTIVTDRQLTYLTISSVEGLSKGGKTELYIPAVEDQWILDEDVQKKVPLEIGRPYRLLSPQSVTYNYPPEEYGLLLPVVRKPVYFFLIHHAKDRTKSFTFRGDMRIWHAPRFTTEVLTPIVRAVSGERVLVRLTNHSRDGVRDSVYIRDSLAYAPGKMFRLPSKGFLHIDTLVPSWSEALMDGTYPLSVRIDDVVVARFVARKFDVRVDSSLTVSVLTNIDRSPSSEALRRLGYQPVVMEHPVSMAERVAKPHVIVAETLPLASQVWAQDSASLMSFVQDGGHLILLPTSIIGRTSIPFSSDVQYKRSLRLDELTNVAFDPQHSLVNVPNALTVEDFEGWIYRRAFNEVALTRRTDFEIPFVAAQTQQPLLLTRRVGEGRITYVDLDLVHQWMNIHAGSFRILANLLALR